MRYLLAWSDPRDERPLPESDEIDTAFADLVASWSEPVGSFEREHLAELAGAVLGPLGLVVVALD